MPRSSDQRPRIVRYAGTSSASAAITIRAVTAAPAVQPVSSSPRANEPDSPKEAADTTASASPLPSREVLRTGMS